MSHSKIVLELKNVSLQKGSVTALHELNLQICAQESIALVGANGSGKTTLLRLIQGLDLATQGQLIRAEQHKIALIHQRPWMLRTNVQNNVALPAWLSGSSWKVAKQRAEQALQRVGLEPLCTRLAPTLSGGQMQRVAIARALAGQPSLLLLDEPTSSLSPQSKEEMESLMLQLSEQGMGLIFASHNLGQVKRLAQRVIALEAGKVVFDGACQDYFESPIAHRP